MTHSLGNLSAWWLQSWYLLFKGFDSGEEEISAEFKIMRMSEAQARASHRNKPTRIRYVVIWIVSDQEKLPYSDKEKQLLSYSVDSSMAFRYNTVLGFVILDSFRDSGSIINTTQSSYNQSCCKYVSGLATEFAEVKIFLEEKRLTCYFWTRPRAIGIRSVRVL